MFADWTRSFLAQSAKKFLVLSQEFHFYCVPRSQRGPHAAAESDLLHDTASGNTRALRQLLELARERGRTGPVRLHLVTRTIEKAPSNVSALVHGAGMRVAETRAVDRALRKAYGIGMCSVEEIGPLTESTRCSEPKKHTAQPAHGNGYGGPRVRDRSSVSINSIPR
jgi:hypothetical protein